MVKIGEKNNWGKEESTESSFCFLPSALASFAFTFTLWP